MCAYGCAYCRRVKILRKPVDQWLFIGVATTDVRPDEFGRTDWDASSYGMWSDGKVIAAGQAVIASCDKLPVASITQPEVFKNREERDKVFSEGSEVVVSWDMAAQQLTLKSDTVEHVICIAPQHQQLQEYWVLNINFGWGEHVIKLLSCGPPPVVSMASLEEQAKLKWRRERASHSS